MIIVGMRKGWGKMVLGGIPGDSREQMLIPGRWFLLRCYASEQFIEGEVGVDAQFRALGLLGLSRFLGLREAELWRSGWC